MEATEGGASVVGAGRTRGRRAVAALVCAGCLAGVPWPAGAIEIGFVDGIRTVAVDRVIELAVAIDPGSSGFGDLFSYGIRLVPEAAAAGRVSLAAVEVPGELDFTGFQSGALVDRSPAVMGVKGNIGFAGGGFTPYAGALLARFRVALHEPGSFVFGLDLFRTVGPSEDVFLAGDGTPLDAHLSFGTTRVTVFALPDVRVDLVADGRDVRVRFGTAWGLHYRLRRSRDLRDWEEAARFDGNGREAAFVDAGAGIAPSWFYSVEVAVPGG